MHPTASIRSIVAEAPVWDNLVDKPSSPVSATMDNGDIFPGDSLLTVCLQTLCRGEVVATRSVRMDADTSGSLQLVCKPCLLETLLDAASPAVSLPKSLADRIIQMLADCGTLTARMLTLLLSPSVARISSLPLGQLTDLADCKFSNLPPLTGMKRINLMYVSTQFDSSLIDYFISSADSLQCLTVSHVESFFNVETIFEFRNLQHLDLSACTVTSEALNTVLSSILCLRSLGLAKLDVSLYSILHGLRHLVHLQLLDLHRLRILPIPDGEDRALSSDSVIGCVSDTFRNLVGIRHLDISEMDYGSEGNVIDPNEFMSNVLSHLRNLEWLDVSETPGLTLTWILSELEQFGHLEKLQFLSFLDASDYNFVVTAGRLPRQLQIACIAADQVEPLLQLQYLKHGNASLTNVLLAIVNWPGDKYEIDTIEHLTSFCVQGLTMMRNFVRNSHFYWLAKCFISCVNRCSAGYEHRLRRIIEKLLETLVVACCANQDDLKVQTILWDVVSRTPVNCSTRLMDRLMYLLAWSLEVVKHADVVLSNEGSADELTDVCLRAADHLIVRFDEQQLEYLGCDLGLVDTLMFLLRACRDESEFSERANYVFNVLWGLTDTSPKNSTLVLVPGGGFDGARFLVDFGFNFLQDSEAALCVLGTLGNAAEVPELRQCLCFGNLFRFVDCALDIDSDGHMARITAAHLLCELCIDKELLNKTTDFGVSHLLAKLGSVFTSIAVKRTQQEEAGGYRNLCPFVEMLSCSNVPQVVLFGLWRIASLCYVNPGFYCPMVFRDGGIHVLRHIEVPDDPHMAERFQECVDIIERMSAAYEDAPVPDEFLAVVSCS